MRQRVKKYAFLNSSSQRYPSPHRPEISGVAERTERQLEMFVRNEQLHTGPSAFYAHADTDDGVRYAGRLQWDPRYRGEDLVDW